MWTWLGIAVISAFLGWIASVAWRASRGSEILLAVGAGLTGGVLGGLFIAPALGGGSIVSGGAFSLPNLLISLLGAFVLLGFATLARRQWVRRTH